MMSATIVNHLQRDELHDTLPNRHYTLHNIMYNTSLSIIMIKGKFYFYNKKKAILKLNVYGRSKMIDIGI